MQPKKVLAIARWRADDPSYQAKGGTMPVGKRSPARGSSAQKVNGVVSPIGDEQQPLDGVAIKVSGRKQRRGNSAPESKPVSGLVSKGPASNRSPDSIPESRRPKRISTVAASQRSSSSRREYREEMAFFAESSGHGLDSLAQDFAEQFLNAVTSGHETHAEAQDRIWEMELGGPFVISSDKRELARGQRGMDGFESEAFPTPSAPQSVPAPDELDEEEEED